jgi:hypothetical protein
VCAFCALPLGAVVTSAAGEEVDLGCRVQVRARGRRGIHWWGCLCIGRNAAL